MVAELVDPHGRQQPGQEERRLDQEGQKWQNGEARGILVGISPTGEKVGDSRLERLLFAVALADGP